jgi:hypothetical protein
LAAGLLEGGPSSSEVSWSRKGKASKCRELLLFKNDEYLLRPRGETGWSSPSEEEGSVDPVKEYSG